MDKEFDGVCMFCGVGGVDIAHISACSFKDAKEKLAHVEGGIGVDVLTKLFNTVSMINTYESVSKEAQAWMYVCTICREFGFSATLPVICPACSGLHTVISVNKYVDDLMAS